MKLFDYKLVKQVVLDRKNNEIESTDIFTEFNELPCSYIHETKRYEYVVLKNVSRKKFFDILGIKKYDKIEYCIIVLNLTFSDKDKYLLFHTDHLIAMEAQIDLQAMVKACEDVYKQNKNNF